MNELIYGNVQIRNNWTPEIDEIRKRLIALSSLPHELIEQAFHYLKGSCSQEIGDLLRDVFADFDRFWIKKVKPKHFSIYNYNRRNTFDAQNHNKILEHKLLPNPTPWNLLSLLKIFQIVLQWSIVLIDNLIYYFKYIQVE